MQRIRVSTIIDPLGRMAEATPLFQPAFLVADAPLLQEKTIFVSFGYYFGLLCFLACIPIGFVFRNIGKGKV